MTPTLHQVDEETDVGVYRAYLRAQSDADLMDIVRHLDPERYPARLDAARRETRRRHVLHLPVYTVAEYAIRYVSVLAFCLSVVTLALAALLTEDEALGSIWPAGAMLPEGIAVSRVGLLLLIGLLRSIVLAAVRLGLYPLTLGLLAGWTLSRARGVWRHQARADVWGMALLALMTLGIALTFACGPSSALPDIFAPAPVRGLTLFNPWA